MGTPFVTVIVPARNEEKTIARCLDSLFAQDYPSDQFEVVVVDGESEDGTVEIASRYPAAILRNPGRTAPHAMNLGLAAAKGEIVFRLDAHAWAAPDYLSRGVALLTCQRAGCVGGPLESIGEGVWGRAIAAAMSCPFGVGNAAFRYAQEAKWVDTVAFGAYWKSVLEELGGFDPELTRNQDDELNFRLTQSGKGILLSPEMRTYYVVRPSLGRLWHQYWQYGFWKVRVLQKHRRPTSVRQLVPPAFVLAQGLGVGLGLAVGLWWPLLAIDLVYGSAAFIAALLTLRGGRERSDGFFLPRVVTAFATMHLAYGTGFIAGLWWFSPFAGWRRGKSA